LVGFVFDHRSGEHYEEWYQGRLGKEALSLERSLIHRLLDPRPGERLLDIGCGAGLHLSWFQGTGLLLTGLDPSSAMLEQARLRLHPGVDLVPGWAEHLPFSDNEFDLSMMINTLEFLDNPADALAEAFRVTRRRVVLGVLNRYGLTSMHRRLKGWLGDTFYRHARFFSVWELKEMVHRILGPNPIRWGTVPLFPLPLLQVVRILEGQALFQHNPCGRLIVMSVDMCYRMIAAKEPLTVPLGRRQGQVPQGTLKAFFLPPSWNEEKPPGALPG
jgi:SAM-dependent methyltransferase